MIQEGLKNIAAGANSIILRKGMKKATDKAVECIKGMSQVVSTKNQMCIRDRIGGVIYARIY